MTHWLPLPFNPLPGAACQREGSGLAHPTPGFMEVPPANNTCMYVRCKCDVVMYIYVMK